MRLPQLPRLPDLAALPMLEQVDAQVPAHAATAPQPDQAQASYPFSLPQPEAANGVPNFTLPDLTLPSLPTFGALGRDPVVDQVPPVPAQLQAALDTALQQPDGRLPQMGLPLLAWPELPRLPFGQPIGQAPAALPALPALANLATANAQKLLVKAEADVLGEPRLQVPRSNPLSVIEGVLAPAASVLQADIDSELSRLEDLVRVPRLGLPLLALSGAQVSAPAPDLAAAMSQVMHPSQLQLSRGLMCWKRCLCWRCPSCLCCQAWHKAMCCKAARLQTWRGRCASLQTLREKLQFTTLFWQTLLARHLSQVCVLFRTIVDH